MNRIGTLLVEGYALVKRIGTALNWLPLTVARFAVGWIFFQSGWGKLHDLGKVTDFFTQLGLPAPAFQAAFTSTTEFVCGSLLLAGSRHSPGSGTAHHYNDRGHPHGAVGPSRFPRCPVRPRGVPVHRAAAWAGDERGRSAVHRLAARASDEHGARRLNCCATAHPRRAPDAASAGKAVRRQDVAYDRTQ